MASSHLAEALEHVVAATSPMSRVRSVVWQSYGLLYDVVFGDGVRELDGRDVQFYFRTTDG
jgi:hypothetical protein